MSKVAKTTILLMVITIISKILGFSRELVLGSVYGATQYSDIYISTTSIPSIIVASIGTAISTIFIPLYYEVYNRYGNRKATEFCNNIINLLLIILGMVSILGIIFTKPLLNIIAIGFNDEQMKLAVNFTRIMMCGGIFLGISDVFSAFLNGKNVFIISGIIGIPYNILIIISIILSYDKGIYLLPIGTLLAMFAKLLVQIPLAYKLKYKYKFKLNLKNEHIRKALCLVTPVFIGILVNQINVIIDRTIASTLTEGSISALNYANRLNGFVMGIFISSIGIVVYPILSKLSSDNNKEKFIQIISNSINSVILVVVPISIGAIVLSEPIVKLLFERGAFNSTATNMTSMALIFYSIGMIGFGLREILGKVFYSLQDTKIPMVNGVISIVMNIVLNLILVRFMGHSGLAFATSISSIICILMLFNSLKKKIGYFGQDKIIKTTRKSLISAIVMGVVTYFMYNILDNILGAGFIQDGIALFGAIGIGAIVYSISVVLLKVEEISVITDTIKKKILSRNKNIESEIESV